MLSVMTLTHSATITNTTLDDRAPEIKYDGTWTGQDGPNFHNQTSTYTGGPNNAMEVSFAGRFTPSHISQQARQYGSTAIRSTTTASSPYTSTTAVRL